MAYHYTSVVPAVTTLAAIGDAIRDNPCQFGMKVVHFSSSLRQLSKRAAKAAGLDPDEIQKVTEYTNLKTFHISYENDVRVKLKAKGLDPDSFDAAPPKGMEWAPGWNRIFLRSLFNPDTFYLRGFVDATTKIRSVFLINGKVANATEDQLIHSCCTNKTSSPSAKQIAAGLDEDEVVTPRSLGVDGIVGFHYTGVDVGTTFDDLCAALA